MSVQILYSPADIRTLFAGKGGKNRRRGKNDSEATKRELTFKEDGQGKMLPWLLATLRKACWACGRALAKGY